MSFSYQNGGKVLECKDFNGDWIDFHYSLQKETKCETL